jgi:hypothetical protein
MKIDKILIFKSIVFLILNLPEVESGDVFTVTSVAYHTYSDFVPDF